MKTDDNLVNLSVIPATTGFVTVYDLDGVFDTCEAVIAWRIETRFLKVGMSLHTDTYPITVDGDPATNCVGVQQPDGTVHIFGTGEMYENLLKMNEQRGKAAA